MKLKIIIAVVLIAASFYWPVESTPVDMDTDNVNDDGIMNIEIEVFRLDTHDDSTYYCIVVCSCMYRSSRYYHYSTSN